MVRNYVRRLAALGLAALMCAASAPALAGSGRWAPARDTEDGAPLINAAAAATEPESMEQLDLRQVEGLPDAEAAAGKEAPVNIKSPSAILIEARSGRVLFEKHSHDRRNPASVTKIMTLIVAFDAIRGGKVKPEDKVLISDEAAKQIGTIIFADSGETFALAELLRSVAVGSANDAAVAVAEHVSGSVEAFVQAMNAKAKELGMNDTQFQNPTGLSAENHLTSAYDIAMMSRYAANNYPELVRLTSVYGDDLQVPWRKNGPTFRLWNNNKLLTWYPGADGLKTGWTQAAGYCLAATAVKNKVRMISVIMGAENSKLRNAEAARLLDYGFSNYTAVELAPTEKTVGMVIVTRGKLARVEAVPQMLFAVSVAKGEQGKVKTEVRLNKRIEAPVKAGQVLGEMIATLDGKEIGKMPLVARTEVAQANIWQAIFIQVKRLFSLS
jgi:D-alanyl-D-alanine carboxypeptidase (penicillin-binding protein 5/6)